MWYLQMRWKVERRHRPRPALLLGRAAAGAVDGGGGGERHGVGLGDQVRQVGEGFRGRAVQQRPVVAEGGGGGGGHEAGGEEGVKQEASRSSICRMLWITSPAPEHRSARSFLDRKQSALPAKCKYYYQNIMTKLTLFSLGVLYRASKAPSRSFRLYKHVETMLTNRGLMLISNRVLNV